MSPLPLLLRISAIKKRIVNSESRTYNREKVLNKIIAYLLIVINYNICTIKCSIDVYAHH